MGVGQIVVPITIIDIKIYMRIVMIMMDLVAVIMIMMMMMIMKVMMKVMMKVIMMVMMVMIITQSFLVPLPWSACPAENETTVARFRECQVRLRCF